MLLVDGGRVVRQTQIIIEKNDAQLERVRAAMQQCSKAAMQRARTASERFTRRVY